MPIAEFRTLIAAPANQVFAWHARPGAFERLQPPWESVRVVERTGGIESGRVVIEVKIGPLKKRWVAQHQDFIPGLQFRDTQVEGPFKKFVHTHRVEPRGPEACELIDHVDYEAPLSGWDLGLGNAFVSGKLKAMFRYRHAITRIDSVAHKGVAPKHFAVSGASGVVGRALVPFLTTGGHQVTRLVRRPPRENDEVEWNSSVGVANAEALESVDAIIHLAGENLASARWTPRRKAEIRASRVDATLALASSLAGMNRKPAAFVTASGVNFYGDRGDAVLTEESSVGSGFLAGLCRDWEAAARPAEDAGIRVVHERMGIVLTSAGGALVKMVPPFRAGVGGRIGGGGQYWSWIAMDDLLLAIYSSAIRPELNGPVNAVAPTALTNQEFVNTLGRVLGRPARVPMPALAARLALGELADEALLASVRAVPVKLQATNMKFAFPGLEEALRHTLGRGEAE